MLAALVPERVLPFASGGSRKRGPGRVGSEILAHDRGGAPKGERSRLSGRGCACASRRGNCGAPFGAPPPSLGSKGIGEQRLGLPKDLASRPFEASFLGKRERRPGCKSHRGNAVPRRHCRACGDDETVRRCLTLDRKIKRSLNPATLSAPGASEPSWCGRRTNVPRS